MRALLWIVLLASMTSTYAAEIAGVHFDDRLKLESGKPELVLNGVGLRTFILFKVYAAGLYVEQKSANAQTLIDATGPRRVAMVMLRDASAKQFSDAFSEGLQDNNPAPQLERFKTEIDQLLGLMQSLGELKKGDQVHVDYVPEQGTRVRINGETKGREIPGLDFYRMILRIWLGDKPVDADLKEGLLGAN